MSPKRHWQLNWNLLTSLTPELSDEERSAMFGARSEDELAQIAMMLMDVTQRQREIIYDALRGWMSEYARSN